jgi:hypothetical protein
MTTTEQPTTRDRYAAVLRSVADGIHLGQTPDTDGMTATLWFHRVTLTDFLTYADRHDAEIQIHRRADTTPGYATIHIRVGTDLLPIGVRVDVNVACMDASEAALKAYATHNAEFGDPCVHDR